MYSFFFLLQMQLFEFRNDEHIPPRTAQICIVFCHSRQRQNKQTMDVQYVLVLVLSN